MPFADALRRDTATRRLLLLTLTALAARARMFGNPIIFSDEEFYLLVARAMWRGALPYVDIWDRKPIGLFLLYLPAAPFSPQAGVYIYQSLALLAVIATAWLVVATARRVGWGRGALVAGILYILCLDLADGQGGQSPVFYNLAMIGAVALLAATRPVERRTALAAMALVGIAIQIKYSVVFEGMWIGLCLMGQEYRTTRSALRTIGWGAVLAVVALAPTAMALSYYVAIGQEQAFVFANFLSILHRHADPAAMQIDNAIVALELLGPLVVLSLASINAAAGDTGQRAARGFLLGWLAVAVAGFVAFGGWYNHYTLPVMLPGCLCTAGFFGDRRLGRRVAAPVIALVFVAGQVVLASELRHRGTPAQFAALVRAVGPGPGSLYGDMGHPALHMFTGRPALTRYLFPSHLQIAREAGAIGVDQAAELDRIFARQPDVVTIEGPDNGAAPARVAQVRALVARGGYGRPTRLPLGREWVDIYHRIARSRPTS
jgi:hypothetical protein